MVLSSKSDIPKNGVIIAEIKLPILIWYIFALFLTAALVVLPFLAIYSTRTPNGYSLNHPLLLVLPVALVGFFQFSRLTISIHLDGNLLKTYGIRGIRRVNLDEIKTAKMAWVMWNGPLKPSLQAIKLTDQTGKSVFINLAIMKKDGKAELSGILFDSLQKADIRCATDGANVWLT